MNVLVTGGAGYIGSAMVARLVRDGHDVVVVDNLSKGRREKVDPKAVFYKVDLMDTEALADVFSKHTFDAVVHFAAYKSVEESMTDVPKYSQNITGTINLLDAMVAFKVPRLVFSSSAAVYGMPTVDVVTEETPTEPINYYGFTKLECERIADWYSRVHGIAVVALRYFNVVGDAGLHYVDEGAVDVLNVLMRCVARDKQFVVNGTDYETLDGSCVRDFVDVRDLVEAHVLSLSKGNGVYNLGTENGTTILELIKTVEEATGKKVNWKEGPNRPGDIIVSISSSRKAQAELGWNSKHSIEESVTGSLSARD